MTVLRLSLPLPLYHPHPVPDPAPRWRAHLAPDDLMPVLAALGAPDGAVPVHLMEQALPLVAEDGAVLLPPEPDWRLELVGTLEARPSEPPPWPCWHGVGGGGVLSPSPRPRRPRQRLLPETGAGTHQRGTTVFVADPTGTYLLAPPEVVATLEARCGASFAEARAPRLAPTPDERAAWAAPELELLAYRWPPGACPLAVRVRAAFIWQACRHECALLAWPDEAPAGAPEVLRRSAGVPDADADAALLRGVRAVLMLAAAGGRPPTFTSRAQYLAVVGAVVAALRRHRQPATASAARRYLLLTAGHDFDAAHWTRLHQRFGFPTWRAVLAALEPPATAEFRQQKSTTRMRRSR